MTIKKIINKLEAKVKKRFPHPSGEHDIYHLKRTLNLALKIQKQEGGDKLVIAVAAFLHDIHRMMRKAGKKYVSPKASLPVVKEILKGINIPKEKLSRIIYCIENHEEYSFSKQGRKSTDLETKIVQDADNLDAVGAIAIARVFHWGGVHDTPIWLPGRPLGRKYYDEDDETDQSQIEHFYSKILRLKDDFNTKTAKKIAVRRHKFIEAYLKQFFAEWDGRL
ncbi:MAG: HD domain-containing protein [Patescibacteria group bacterium]|jgi:uncharacterized protein